MPATDLVAAGQFTLSAGLARRCSPVQGAAIAGTVGSLRWPMVRAVLGGV